MKKFFALLCAGVMACSMSMMAFAAPSQTTSTVTGGSGQTTSTVTGSSSQTTGTATSGAAASTNNSGHSTVDSVKVWSNIIIDGQSVDPKDLSIEALPATSDAAKAATAWAAANSGTVLHMIDVKLSANFSSVTIPFNLTNVKAGQNIVALHLKHDGKWEQLPCVVENGKVTVTFTSLSPVVFVSLSTPVKSPKTGDTSAVPFATAAVVAAAGAVIATRKYFK